MKEYLERVLEEDNLGESTAFELMQSIMDGAYSDVEIGGLLVALRARGESVDEITGFARAMRSKMSSIQLNVEAMDLCGTGGDASGTFNVSTAASLVVAGAGIPVAKHGNRSISSKSGSADVLQELGVNIDLGVEGVQKCIEEIGLGFLFAPSFHPAMRFVMPARKALRIRTVFNILGPLCNPCEVSSQLMGVFDTKLVSTLGRVLQRLGVDRAMVVAGQDGLDELSLCASSTVCRVSADEIRDGVLNPSDFGLQTCQLVDLAGGDAKENARIIIDILEGKTGAPSDMVVLNAAGAIATFKSLELEEGVKLARESIAEGLAMNVLRKLREVQ